MIRIDAIWLATEPMDMRAGTETALARVIAVFGAAKPHCAYLFANRRANRMKVLVHDGVGIWLAARRLNQGKFHWPGIRHGCESNSTASNFRRWCWACRGSASAQAVRSQCCKRRPLARSVVVAPALAQSAA
jgi:hypothetical protein